MVFKVLSSLILFFLQLSVLQLKSSTFNSNLYKGKSVFKLTLVQNIGIGFVVLNLIISREYYNLEQMVFTSQWEYLESLCFAQLIE